MTINELMLVEAKYMIISDNHLFMTAGTDMRNLISPLQTHDIHYFTYNKHYTDGRRIRLTTHPHHLKAFLENKYYLTGNIDAIPELYENQAVLLSTLKNQLLVEWLRKDFGVANGVYVIRKSEAFTEYFSFGSTPDNTKIVNFYLNNLDYLQGFCDSFKDNGKLLLEQAEKNTLIHDYHHDAIVNVPKASVLLNKQFANLSKRENEVAALLLTGATAKEIALSLHLSFRTIQDYIGSIRDKYHARNIRELLIKLIK